MLLPAASRLLLIFFAGISLKVLFPQKICLSVTNEAIPLSREGVNVPSLATKWMVRVSFEIEAVYPLPETTASTTGEINSPSSLNVYRYKDSTPFSTSPVAFVISRAFGASTENERETIDPSVG